MLPPEAIDTDPQLADLRARRMRQLLAARAELHRLPAGPVSISGETVGDFLSRNPRAVIDVWAPWCGPCRAMAPILDALSREFGGAVAFGKVSADEEPALARQWNVEGIPTLLLFRDGDLADRLIGALPGSVLRSRIRATLCDHPSA